MGWSPEAGLIAWNSRQQLLISSEAAGDSPTESGEPQNAIEPLSFLRLTDDGSILFGGQAGILKTTILTDRIPSAELLTKSSPLDDSGIMEVSRDGQLLVGVTLAGQIDFIDLNSGEVRRAVTTLTPLPVHLEIHPENSHLIAADISGSVRVLETEFGLEVAKLEVPTGSGSISALSWSPDGETIGAGLSSGEAVFWSTSEQTRRFIEDPSRPPFAPPFDYPADLPPSC